MRRVEKEQAVASMVFEACKYIYPLAFVVGAGRFARTSRDTFDPVTTSEADLSMERGGERPAPAIQSIGLPGVTGHDRPMLKPGQRGENSQSATLNGIQI